MQAAQTRIENSYLDYNSVVIEDPTLVHVSNGYFIGDVFTLYRRRVAGYLGLAMTNGSGGVVAGYLGLAMTNGSNNIVVVESEKGFDGVISVLIDQHNIAEAHFSICLFVFAD
ncbi:hypothetical protein ACH5RR_018494 [Cinchona calisaya]|uniref:Uncharacterized protein n=1 Tax=Cinchona calisaya TaxID=153742 RepID=A0ABD2ZPR5_9GENT